MASHCLTLISMVQRILQDLVPLTSDGSSCVPLVMSLQWSPKWCVARTGEVEQPFCALALSAGLTTSAYINQFPKRQCLHLFVSGSLQKLQKEIAQPVSGRSWKCWRGLTSPGNSLQLGLRTVKCPSFIISGRDQSEDIFQGLWERIWDSPLPVSQQVSLPPLPWMLAEDVSPLGQRQDLCASAQQEAGAFAAHWFPLNTQSVGCCGESWWLPPCTQRSLCILSWKRLA